MRKYITYHFCIFILIITKSISAQDIHLSQFYESPLLRNPALAGIFTGNIRVQAVIRNQWNWSGAPYKTNSLSAEIKFPIGYSNDYLTIGLQTFQDIAGSSKLKTIQAMPAINFHKSLSDQRSAYLSGGIMAGFINKHFDLNNLSFNNQYVNGSFDPSAATGENINTTSRTMLDMAVGLCYSNVLTEEGSYYFGAALFHFNQPKESFKDAVVELPVKLQLNGGINLSLANSASVIIEGNYSDQADHKEFMLGGLYSYHFRTNVENVDETKLLDQLSISAGAFMRLHDALIPVIKFTYNKIEIGLSYDVNISTLKTTSNGHGGYELSCTYKLMKRSVAQAQQLCPRF
jgi:type IX secretion system PorP/SprF family membrane protein